MDNTMEWTDYEYEKVVRSVMDRKSWKPCKGWHTKRKIDERCDIHVNQSGSYLWLTNAWLYLAPIRILYS